MQRNGARRTAGRVGLPPALLDLRRQRAAKLLHRRDRGLEIGWPSQFSFRVREAAGVTASAGGEGGSVDRVARRARTHSAQGHVFFTRQPPFVKGSG